MADKSGEVSMFLTMVSGQEIQLSSPSFQGESVQQLRLRVAEKLSVPCGQIALLCGAELLRDNQKLGSLPCAQGACEVTVMVSRKWDEKLQELLVDRSYFSAVGICSLSDGSLFAYSQGAEQKLQAPDQMKDEEGKPIDEARCLKEAVEGRVSGGLWLAGKKLRILQHDADEELTTVLAISTNWRHDGLGLVAISTGSNVLMCRFDEPGVTLQAILGMLRKEASAFADLLKAQGM
ncbi:unnamed protein product [Effrenium voratum]|nr:unnamed protein product [Effrenium voratum]